MHKMVCRKKILMYLIVAAFITILCFTAVHNAAIREHNQGDEADNLDKLSSNAVKDAKLDIQEIPQVPESKKIKYQVNIPNENDIKQNIDGLELDMKEPFVKDSNDNIGEQILKPMDTRKEDTGDEKGPIELDDKLQKANEPENFEEKLKEVFEPKAIPIADINPIDPGKIHAPELRDNAREEVLRFRPDEVRNDNLEDNGDQPVEIFGVGERELDIRDAKPLPIVKAPRSIDALVDAREKDGRNVLVMDDPLELDDLQPPDHLDAVRLEQDGHLNLKYQREVFFGEHEEFENLNEEEMAKKLEEIFKKVDVNKNHYITVDELEDWIVAKTNEHFVEARKENQEIFNSLDTNSDGAISWEEFEIQFLMTLGFTEEEARKYARGRDDDIPLDIEDRERLIRYKYKWAEAEHEPLDNKLTVEEFQAFRHPESSQIMLEQMVHDIIDNLDTNKDGYVSEIEFIALPQGEYDESEMDRNWQKQRRKEFKNVIDTDHDGRVNKKEMFDYVNPQNPNHAKLEARNLIELGDSNGDDRLSLAEVIENMDLFYGSKMVNTALSFHDEF